MNGCGSRTVRRRRGRGIMVVAGLVAAIGGAAADVAARPNAQTPPLPQTVEATIDVGARPVGIGVNPVTHKVYVTNATGNSVSVIDGVTLKVVKTLAVGNTPWYWIGVMPARNRIYVANNGSGTLSVIDGATDAVVATVGGLTGAPEGVGADDGRNLVYVTRAGSLMSVVDGATQQVLRTVNTGAFNHSAVVSPSLGRIYVSRTAPDVLSVFDTNSLALVGDIAATGHPALDPGTEQVWLADFRSPRLWRVDGRSNAVLDQLPITYAPLLAAIDTTRGCLYATNPSAGQLTVVDIVNRRELGQLTVGRTPGGVGVDPVTGRVFVANEASNTVTVIKGARCDQPATAPTPTATALPSATPSPTASATPSPTASATTRPTTTASATPSQTTAPSPTLTPVLTPTTPPSSTPAPVSACICRTVRERVPPAVINDAVANPGRYEGWMRPLDPNKPPSPANPPRACLALQNADLPYHPLWNTPLWRVGCR